MSAILAKLDITLDADHKFSVTGQIDDKILAYGLLEMAKEVIHAHHEQKRIVASNAAEMRAFVGKKTF